MREGIAYKSLSVVCTKITDGSHFSPKADENGSYPMLSVKDMMASGFEYTSCKYINEHDYKVLVANGCKPKFNDVLVAKDGSYLKTAFVLKEEREQAVLSSIAIITPRLDEINPDYLAFFFKAPYTKAVVEKHYLTGTAIKRIIIKGFRGIKIPIPPLSEQHRIVSELELLSGIIEKKKAQLKEYDQLAQSIFYDMFGDPIENPKGWEVKKLGEVCKKITDGTHDTPQRLEKGVKFITGKHIRPFLVDYDNSDYVTEEVHKEIFQRCNPELGDVLYTNIGAGIGNAAINTVEYEFSMKNVALLKPLRSIVNGYFLEFYLNNDKIKTIIIDNYSNGGAQKFLSLKSIAKITVPLPPLSLQQSFAEKIEAIEKQKSLIQQSIAETQTMFDFTMDKYFG